MLTQSHGPQYWRGEYRCSLTVDARIQHGCGHMTGLSPPCGACRRSVVRGLVLAALVAVCLGLLVGDPDADSGVVVSLERVLL